MEPFTVETGTAVVLRRDNVDTDQIIPSDYLKRVTRTGFADGLFRHWRDEGTFRLDEPAHAGASILVAGADFGTGSSREHAVWALQDWGFRAVISPRFGDIFRGNAYKAGLLAVVLPPDAAERLMTTVETDPSVAVTVDLVAQTVTAGDLAATFEIDPFTRERLLAGLDDIALTLQHADLIQAYAARRPAYLPRIS